MDTVSTWVRYDSVLKQYTVDFLEGGHNEMAVFDTALEAEKFVKQLHSKGYSYSG